MSANTILAIAQSGIQNGMTGLKKNASQLASKDFLQPGGSLPAEGSLQAEGSLPAEGSSQAKDTYQLKGSAINELVEMKMNKYQVLASGKVIETVEQMLGSLLDEKA